MFAQNPFNNTNVNSLLASSSLSFHASSEGDTELPKNRIFAFMPSSGVYAGKKRYVVNYSVPTGTLQSMGVNMLHEAMAEARSGNNSLSKEFEIESYWKIDEWLSVWNGAPAGLAIDVQPEPAPEPMPLPTPAPTPAPTPPPATEEDDTTTDEEKEEEISTQSDTPEEVETEKETRPAFILLPIIALAGIGYFTFQESKKK